MDKDWEDIIEKAREINPDGSPVYSADELYEEWEEILEAHETEGYWEG